MECEQTMTDNAETRDAEHLAKSVLAAGDSPGFGLWKPWAMDLADAVIALVAERDELLGLWHCTPEDKAGMDANLLRVEAERDTANADWHRMRDLHADALTEVERLKEAMDLAMHDHGNAYEILGDALANEDA